MFEALKPFLELQNLVTLLIGLSAFATILTIASPFLAGDKMRTRMKAVASEKDILKQQSRAQLEASAGRLREKPKGTMAQIVQALNLREVFAGEVARMRLRQAGYRSERHLVTYLGARAVTPLIFGVVVFIYTSTVFADQVPSTMRLVAAIVGAMAGFYAPNLYLANAIKKRQKSIQRAWSDALDLLLICVESGMSIEAAINRVSGEIGAQSIPLAEELTLTTAELSFLGDRRKAFVNLGNRTGLPTVRSVVTSLVQSERYGTPLGQALRVLAQENRDDRMADAEKRAAALPPKLTVPMVLFFLPVIFCVLLGPAAILTFAK